ncbi:MAG TPA: hypothetical protein VEQ67_08175 [Mycobacterium sp.]|nr:hypothetical protein [Mycobacterium sp.]
MVTDFLVRLSIRSAMFAGAITGFVFGLFAGAILGALVSWFAGAIVDWQAQLGFSLGIAQQLLPLGNQVKSLESVSDRWFLVIPAVGLLVGILGALIGLLAGGLWAALVNMGVLPIQVTVYRSGERVAVRRSAGRQVRRDRRRKAVNE